MLTDNGNIYSSLNNLSFSFYFIYLFFLQSLLSARRCEADPLRGMLSSDSSCLFCRQCF